MQTKKWYQSKTIWGIVIAAIGYVLSSILKVDGIEYPVNGDFNELKKYAEAVKASQNDWSALLGNLMSAIGFVVAIIGRIKADTTINLGGLNVSKPTH